MTKRNSEAERYRTLFETVALGIIYRDAKGRIISANPAAGKFFGDSSPNLEGRGWDDLPWLMVDEECRPVHKEDYPPRRALRTGQEIRGAVVGLVQGEGEVERWLLLDAVPQFRAGERKPYQVYTICRDITNERDQDLKGRRRESRLRRSNTSLRTLSRQLIRGHDEERRSVAYRLHEGVVQSLAALSCNLNLLEKIVDSLPEDAQPLLETSVAIASECSRELQQISQELHPLLLRELGLRGALEMYIRGLPHATAEVSLAAGRRIPRFEPKTEIALFRAIQDLIAALLSHSETAGVAVALRFAKKLRIQVIASARGSANSCPDWTAATRGNAHLLLAQERLQNANCRLRMEPVPPAGFRLAIEVPAAHVTM